MHPSDEDLELHRTGHLSLSQSLTIKSHLSGCKLCESKLQLLFQLSRWQNGTERQERRQEVRTLVDEPASVRVLQGSFGSLECQVLDRSKGGLKLLVSKPLEPGTIVQIRLKRTIVMGEVRYCVRVNTAFHVGLKVEDVVRISGR